MHGGGFIEILEQVCRKRGKTCFAVDAKGTSQNLPDVQRPCAETAVGQVAQMQRPGLWV